jgi:hypothetical protein
VWARGRAAPALAAAWGFLLAFPDIAARGNAWRAGIGLLPYLVVAISLMALAVVVTSFVYTYRLRAEKKRLEHLNAVHEAMVKSARSSTMEEALSPMLDSLWDILRAHFMAIFSRDPASGLWRVAAITLKNHHRVPEEVVLLLDRPERFPSTAAIAPLDYVCRERHLLLMTRQMLRDMYPRIPKGFLTSEMAYAALPLLIGKRCGGVMLVGIEREKLSPSEASFLEAFASEAASVLERVRLQEVTAKQLRERTIASRVAEAVAGSLTPDVVVTKAQSVIREAFGADGPDLGWFQSRLTITARLLDRKSPDATPE